MAAHLVIGRVLLRQIVAGVIAFCMLLFCQRADAQNLLNDNYTTSSTRLGIKRYATIPNTGGSTNDIISITTRPDEDSLYVSTQDGRIHRVTPTSNGLGSASLWFNINSDVPINLGNPVHGGLRSVAFHPDFAQPAKEGYGKVYASIVGNSTGSANFLGNSSGGTQSVVGEWTYDFDSGSIGNGTFRELFRVRNPEFDHPIKQLTFNPLARSTDPDYGLLYIAHGDGSQFNGSYQGDGQNLQDALGKVLRINPLDPDGDGDLRYTTPGNFFALDEEEDEQNPDTLAEIYSWGHRNPHHLTFAKDRQGVTHLIAAEVGQDNIEEINVVVNGANYGWGERTGTFTFDKTTGYTLGTGTLPSDDAALNDFIYPAAQVDHDDLTGNRRIGVAGGYIGSNGGETGLQGRYLFGDFAAKGSGIETSGGQIWSIDFDELTSLKTSLANGESPALLETVDDFDLHELAFDHDNNPDTPAQIHDDFVSLLAADGTGSGTSGRANFRFGTGPAGELYLSSKQNGRIYLVTNTLSNFVSGDADRDGDVDGADFLAIQRGFPNAQSPNSIAAWQNNFGNGLAATTAVNTIPEPTAIVLLGVAYAIFFSRGFNTCQH